MKNYYYLYKDKRPEDQEVYESKQYLLTKNRINGLGKKPAEAKKVKKVFISSYINKAKILDDKDDTFQINLAVDIYIIYNFSLFDKAIYKEKRYKFVVIRDGSQYRIHNINTISINPLINGDYKELDLVNIYYVLNIEYNLLSLGTLEWNSYKF